MKKVKNPENVRIGRLSRRKGATFERDIAKDLKHIFPKAMRLLESQEGFGYDLKNVGCLRIQCKRGRKYAPLTKIEEAGTQGIPMLVTRADDKEALVALRWSDFLKILDNPKIITEVLDGQGS